MDYQALKQEIVAGPLAVELVGKSDDDVAAILNATRFQTVKERFITARTVLNELGPVIGSGVLDKLEAAAQSSSPLKWAMKFLTTDGIDIGAASTRGQIDALVAYSVLTVDEGQQINDMALQPISRAEILGFGTVSYNDVNIARAL